MKVIQILEIGTEEKVVNSWAIRYPFDSNFVLREVDAVNTHNFLVDTALHSIVSANSMFGSLKEVTTKEDQNKDQRRFNFCSSESKSLNTRTERVFQIQRM